LASPLFRLFVVVFSCFPFLVLLYSSSLFPYSTWFRKSTHSLRNSIPRPTRYIFKIILIWDSITHSDCCWSTICHKIGLLFAFGPLLPILLLRPTSSLVDNPPPA
jgi:hypothetical protein